MLDPRRTITVMIKGRPQTLVIGSSLHAAWLRAQARKAKATSSIPEPAADVAAAPQPPTPTLPQQQEHPTMARGRKKIEKVYRFDPQALDRHLQELKDRQQRCDDTNMSKTRYFQIMEKDGIHTEALKLVVKMQKLGGRAPGKLKDFLTYFDRYREHLLTDMERDLFEEADGDESAQGEPAMLEAMKAPTAEQVKAYHEGRALFVANPNATDQDLPDWVVNSNPPVHFDFWNGFHDQKGAKPVPVAFIKPEGAAAAPQPTEETAKPARRRRSQAEGGQGPAETPSAATAGSYDPESLTMKAGRQSALLGHRKESCKHKPGTPDHTRWMVGYAFGEDELRNARAAGEKAFDDGLTIKDGPHEDAEGAESALLAEWRTGFQLRMDANKRGGAAPVAPPVGGDLATVH